MVSSEIFIGHQWTWIFPPHSLAPVRVVTERNRDAYHFTWPIKLTTLCFIRLNATRILDQNPHAARSVLGTFTAEIVDPGTCRVRCQHCQASPKNRLNKLVLLLMATEIPDSPVEVAKNNLSQ